jgi:hypothetical protein
MKRVVVPGLPTTVFVIAASCLFARSSPKFDGWLRANRWFGPGLRRFRESGGMTRPMKAAALTSMWVAIGLSSGPLAAVHVAGALVTVALGGAGTVAIVYGVRTVEGRGGSREEADDLGSLDEHVGGVGRQCFQVAGIGREDGSSGFRECHDKRIDGRPATGEPSQLGCSPRERLRDRIGDVTGLEKAILVRVAPRVSLQALHENHRRYRRRP